MSKVVIANLVFANTEAERPHDVFVSYARPERIHRHKWNIFGKLMESFAQESSVIGIEINKALMALHSHRLIHRDIQPCHSSLLSGRLTFHSAIATVVEPFKSFDVPGWIPSESKAGAPDDIYTLGALLYQAILGPVGRLSLLAVKTGPLHKQPRYIFRDEALVAHEFIVNLSSKVLGNEILCSIHPISPGYPSNDNPLAVAKSVAFRIPKVSTIPDTLAGCHLYIPLSATRTSSNRLDAWFEDDMDEMFAVPYRYIDQRKQDACLLRAPKQEEYERLASSLPYSLPYTVQPYSGKLTPTDPLLNSRQSRNTPRVVSEDCLDLLDVSQWHSEPIIRDTIPLIYSAVSQSVRDELRNSLISSRQGQMGSDFGIVLRVLALHAQAQTSENPLAFASLRKPERGRRRLAVLIFKSLESFLMKEGDRAEKLHYMSPEELGDVFGRAWNSLRIRTDFTRLALGLVNDCVAREGLTGVAAIGARVLWAMGMKLRFRKCPSLLGSVLTIDTVHRVIIHAELPEDDKAWHMMHELSHIILEHGHTADYLIYGDKIAGKEKRLLEDQEAQADCVADWLLEILTLLDRTARSSPINGVASIRKTASMLFELAHRVGAGGPSPPGRKAHLFMEERATEEKQLTGSTMPSNSETCND